MDEWLHDAVFDGERSKQERGKGRNVKVVPKLPTRRGRLLSHHSTRWLGAAGEVNME